MDDPCGNGYVMLPRALSLRLIGMGPITLEIYLYFYAKAHWKRNNGKPVGELEISWPQARPELVKMVGYRKEEPITEEAWHATTKALRTAKLITTTKTKRGMRVSICHYERYTDPKAYEIHSESNNEGNTKPDTESKTPSYREELKKEDSQSGGGEAPGAAPEKKENIGSNRAWEKWYRDFRACPGCVDVNRMAFENTIKGALYADPGLDVGEVIAEFGRKWSGGRPAKPIAALEAELARHLPEKETGEPPAPPAWTPSFGFKSKKGEGI